MLVTYAYVTYVLYVRGLVVCPHKKWDSEEVNTVSALLVVVADTTFALTSVILPPAIG